MKRRILIVLLALGTIAGFGMGFASLHRRSHWGQRGAFHGAFEQRVAEICAASALKVSQAQKPAAEAIRAPPGR